MNSATDYGLQIRGHGEVSDMTAAGNVLLEDVRIAGTYKKAHLAVQRYSDAAGVVMNGVVLGGALQNVSTGDGTVGVDASRAGWSAFFSSDMRGGLPLGDTAFAGGTFDFGDIRIGGETAGLRVHASQVEFSDIERTHSASGVENFAIEDRVEHALDDAGIGGLVIWQPGDLYVTPDSGSIQRGINAASAGNVVNVDAGTYAEQLLVTKDLTLTGADALSTVVRAPNALAPDASGMRSILTIGGGAEVEVSGFTFQGPVPAINAGIFVRDGAHANIHDNRIIDIREPGLSLSGNQRGIGIFVGRALLSTSGTAVIANNEIRGYQKGGIVVDGPGSQATITDNTVVGEGPTVALAQNGIQVSRGASASLAGNNVSGNAYTGPGTDPDDFAAGILFFVSNPYLGTGGMTLASSNIITGNEFGVWTNDPGPLATMNLSGVSGNTRNAVAFFNGGYAGQGPLLEYPAWSASNAALVSAGAFSSSQAGDMLEVGGAVRVAGWSGFSAIQPAVNAVALGGTVDVAAGTYAEDVVVGGLRNLTFGGATLQSLTVNAAGSGIAGSATASGPGGFVFSAPVVLLGDTSLSTTGANIAFNGDVQNAGATPFALSLSAGSGDVLLVSGGSATNPIGMLDVAANNFSLAGTMWVSGYEIDAAGTVALSVSTLRSVGGNDSSISAGGDITGSTVSEGPVDIQSGGDVLMTNIISSSGITIEAANQVVANIETPTQVVIDSGGPVQITGSAPSVVLDAPGGSVTGSFGGVTNTGTGVVEVNGKPEVPQTVSASFDPSRILPQETSDNAAPAAAAEGDDVYFSTSEDERRGARIVRAAPQEAGAALDLGMGVELDLTPRNTR